MINKIHGNTGKKRSEETRRRLSEANRGRRHSDETKQRIGMARRRENLSEETIRKITGPNHHSYCFYYSNNIPKYDVFVSHLEPYEPCRRGVDDSVVLEVRCAYCGKWFTPTIKRVENRIKGIKISDTYRFYCSDDCRNECPIYRQKRHYKGQEGSNSREVQPELRQLVFARDDYTCQRCGSAQSLHCHHIEPVKMNPIESADLDVCITLCKYCHRWVHKNIDGCSYRDLGDCIG